MAESPSRRTGQTGFTLIEVLIALAITGMVVSVLMTSVFYGIKVQSAIRGELQDREQLLRSKAWFVELLASCLPADAASGSAFEGGALEIVCDSLMPLQGKKHLGAQRIWLSLRAGAAPNRQLVYRQSRADAAGQVIAELPPGEAAFRFVGTNGEDVAKWPADRNDPETLPRRIRLVVKRSAGEGSGFEWSVGVRASPWLEPVVKLPFGGELPR
ncbi:type II secretion system protein J [Rhodoferax sp.]|uniref:PulJ/GspJ family protein n=1 Tax=Rhodoferax sp. TaxID=50421 RepID=UPI002748C78C|nr:prepilin-type N-terminal cleavage/methylation domain-containing protein [Rhodoferax sp.]